MLYIERLFLISFVLSSLSSFHFSADCYPFRFPFYPFSCLFPFLSASLCSENPNLFVNFLPAHVTDDGLRALFVPYGTVSFVSLNIILASFLLNLEPARSACCFALRLFL